MSAMSDYLESALGNHVLRNIAYTSPVTIYAALYTTDPTDADTGTEVAGGAYVRQAITFGAPATPGVFWNNAIVTFPQATANWGVIGWLGIRDAVSGGNLLLHGALVTQKTIEQDDIFRFLANKVNVNWQ